MNNKKTSLIIVGSLVVIFAFLFLVYKLTNTPVDYSQVTKIRAGDHVTWTKDSKHVLVEYSDLQCPACKNFNELLHSWESSQSAQSGIPKKVALVYRAFPLYQIHPEAFTLAYAAEAAGKQGKFFEMLNALFDGQPQLEAGTSAEGLIQEKAKAIGLDVAKLKQDMDSSDVKNKVADDLTDGEKIGINQTPTFFLDGKKLEFRTVDEFVQILSNIK